MMPAILVGIALWLLLGRVVTGAWPEMRALFGDVAPAFPSARLGVPTALLITASPLLVDRPGVSEPTAPN